MALSEQRTLQRYPLDHSSLDSIRLLQSERTPNLLAQLIDLYLNDAPMLLDQLRTAVADDDAATIIQHAHRLKGSSASFGATRFVDLCGELEELGRAGDTRGAAKILTRLEREYTRVRNALQSEKFGPTRL